MERPAGIRAQLWQMFLERHAISPREQDAFVAYLARSGALPVESLQDLEDDYLDFLQSGPGPDP